MHLIYLLFASIIPLAKCAPRISPSSKILHSLNLTDDELGATVFALLYGTPLLAFYQLANTTLPSIGTNVLGNKNSTATASTRSVVRPNVDTIYGTATYDLSATDLVLTVPPMEEGRFYLFAFYDPSVLNSHASVDDVQHLRKVELFNG
jgi:hypothetical protein